MTTVTAKSVLKTTPGPGWLIAFLGYPPGGALAALLIGHLDTPLEGIIGGAAAGLVIGAAQALALRSRLPVGWKWVAVTVVGLVVGVSSGVLIVGNETSLNAVLLRAAVTGLSVGIAQWLILREGLKQAGWWIPVNIPLYVIAWYVTAQVIGTSLNEGFVIFGASGALVYQAVTGLVLRAMMHYNP